MKRLFIAVNFDKETKAFVKEVQTRVEAVSSKGKFHREENLHLTLEFIGMLPDKLINVLGRSIEQALLGEKAFDIRLDHLAYFEKKNKKIPWLGVENPKDLERLQKKLVEAVAKVIDHPTEHAYTPHVTLGRQVVLEDLPELENTLKVRVFQIALMESSSASGTLLYTPLKLYDLEV